MKIAMIGQKGVPATHGGVERHVEELSARLAHKGHEVTVFTRPNYSDPSLHDHRGIRLKSLPTIGTKHLDAIVHSLLASLFCWKGGYDVVHYHGIGPCLVSPLSRLRGRAVVATIHGQDWRRGKWGTAASAVLRLGEWMALRVPDVTISVSKSLSRLYEQQAGRKVEYIPNGITIYPDDDHGVLAEFNLRSGAYLLFVGRLVPEKGLHCLIDAYGQAQVSIPLVVTGESSNTDDYVAALRQKAGNDVIFTGYQYGASLAALFRHAALFVLSSDLEGLPIVLLEALAYGVPVLVSDIPPNREVLGDSGEYFARGDSVDLARALSDCLGRLASLRERVDLLKGRVVKDYDWDKVTEQTERIYQRVARHPGIPA
jgi:glycosyltransferase involved in cell wall biosynthesis